MKSSASSSNHIYQRRQTLEKLAIRPSTFYRWYERFRAGGPEALADEPSKPDRVWNRIPDEVRERIITMALEIPELSPRELATRFTDRQAYSVSESSVYRLLKSHDLITSPAFIVIKAADEFKDKTTAINQLWQTDSIMRMSEGSFCRRQVGVLFHRYVGAILCRHRRGK